MERIPSKMNIENFTYNLSLQEYLVLREVLKNGDVTYAQLRDKFGCLDMFYITGKLMMDGLLKYSVGHSAYGYYYPTDEARQVVDYWKAAMGITAL